MKRGGFSGLSVWWYRYWRYGPYSGINSAFVGGDGAGFPAYLFGGTDIGDTAPTVVQILAIALLVGINYAFLHRLHKQL